MWLIGRPDTSRSPLPTTVVYGEVPKDWTEEEKAAPLQPGCYEVLASGPYASAGMPFFIDSAKRLQKARVYIESRHTKFAPIPAGDSAIQRR